MDKKRVGDYQTIRASGITVKGDYNKIHGDNNTIHGDYNTVYGNNNVGEGDYNESFGGGNYWKGDYNKVRARKMDPQPATIPSSNVIMRGTPVKRMIMAKPVIRGINIGCVGNHSTTNVIEEKPEKRKREEEEEEEPLFVECPLESDKDSPLPEDSVEGIPSCVICTTNTPCCVIMPCMHKSLCCACSRVLASEGTKQRGEVKCPMCQAEVHKIAKVYE